MKRSTLPWNSRLLILMGLSVALLLLGTQDRCWADDTWFEFTLPWNDGSPSFFFEESGPITQPIRVGNDGDLHLGSATGPQIRLFGVGMPVFPTHSQAASTAARLAKFGVNLVHFPLIDSLLTGTNPITFDSGLLDRLFYFISQLKNQGIYVGLTLFDCDSLEVQRPVGLFIPEKIQCQKDAAEELLTYDPGSLGIHDLDRLVDDPVLAYLQFDNERFILAAFQICELDPDPGCDTVAPKALTPDESDFLDQKWNEKLLAHYGNRSMLKQSWEEGCNLPSSGKISLEDSEDPDPNGDGDASDGTVKRIEFRYENDYNKTADVFFCPKRLIDEVTFYMQVEREYVREMFDFLTDPPPGGLGLQVPITAMANFDGVADKMVQAETNAMAQHSPWAHPCSWSLCSSGEELFDPTFQFINWPMTKGPVPLPSSPTPMYPTYWPAWVETRNIIWRTAVASSVKGKPLILSETNHPLPNEFQAEGMLLVSAYAAFQGWDMIYLHEYANKYAASFQPLALGEAGSGMIEQPFEIADDPVVMAQVPAAARLFRNGWVQEGSEALAIDVPFWEDFALDGDCGALNDWWKCHGDYYCYWENTNLDNTKNVDPAWSLVHKLRMEFTPGPVTPPSPGTPSQPYVSDTGELHWDMSQGSFGLVTIDTSWVNAAIGSVNTDPQLSTLKIDATTDFAAISLVPLDDQPLASSSKLLLTAAGRLRNKNMVPDWHRLLGEHTLSSWGESPVQLEPVEAQVTLTLPQAGLIRVYRLDETGNLDTQVAYQVGSEITFDIGSHDTLWYGIVVEPTDTAAVFRVTKEGDVLADKTYYGQAFHSGSADVAEWVPVSDLVEPGDVLELDPENPGCYRKARGPCSTLVAGVVSTEPGVILGSSSPALDIGPWTLDSALLALLGIVPVKVTCEAGPIQPGDLLVTSSTAGYAMRWSPEGGAPCGLVGKALEPLTDPNGVILVLLMAH